MHLDTPSSNTQQKIFYHSKKVFRLEKYLPCFGIQHVHRIWWAGFYGTSWLHNVLCSWCCIQIWWGCFLSEKKRLKDRSVCVYS